MPFFGDFDVNLAFLVVFGVFMPGYLLGDIDKEVKGKFFLQIPLWLRNKYTQPAGGTSLLTDPGCNFVLLSSSSSELQQQQRAVTLAMRRAVSAQRNGF